jgi:hypothetical protein
MIDIPLLDDEYRQALLYLMEVIDEIQKCSDAQMPWYPKDEDRLETSRRVYERWHPDEDKNTIINFPWPKPGEVPNIAADLLKPTEDEISKVKRFIDQNDGPDMDPLTGMIVDLAKELIKEIH